jgi:hypothetical protein
MDVNNPNKELNSDFVSLDINKKAREKKQKLDLGTIIILGC